MWAFDSNSATMREYLKLKNVFRSIFYPIVELLSGFVTVSTKNSNKLESTIIHLLQFPITVLHKKTKSSK